MIQKVWNKLKCNVGGGTIHAVYVLMFCMLLISVVMEYYRIQITALEIQAAYEKAIITVATENYNEIYTGVREEDALGGIYEGGAESKRNSEEVPEWVPLHDYGAVMEELTDLLNLQNEAELLIKENQGTKEYELDNFEIEVKNEVDSTIHRYEVRGNANLKMPFYFCGVNVTDVNLNLKISSAYTSKYD